ncbi:hypothetical protein [Bacteroides fragilis]|uniref:hypothetical protein n=1 Tax=Bacteroides fragilis TaxID=817 RepID=UPI0022AA9004|nr:hypothetical protein [Bacteroides fragilis]MCZ2663064.1 hypothetical protein [Bacteroides fragilis]
MEQIIEQAAIVFAEKCRIANFKGGLDYPYDDLDMRNAFEGGAEFAKSQSPWIKAKDQLPFVDEDDISEQSEPVLVIASAKGHYEPEILVYNKHYHVWDTADADDYYCDVSDNDLWMPIPKYNV